MAGGEAVVTAVMAMLLVNTLGGDFVAIPCVVAALGDWENRDASLAWIAQKALRAMKSMGRACQPDFSATPVLFQMFQAGSGRGTAPASHHQRHASYVMGDVRHGRRDRGRAT